MAPKKIGWKHLKPPQTAQQKIQYMTACQCWFTQVMNRNYKKPCLKIEKLEIYPNNYISNSFIGYDQSIFAMNDYFECIICKNIKNIASDFQHEINPFSFLTVLICQDCNLENISANNIG